MDTFTREELNQLLDISGECVSIYLPTNRVNASSGKTDAITYKNLLTKAEEESKKLDFTQAKRLIDDELFWKHQSEGLAVFLSEGTFRTFRVPIKFTESYASSDKFFITPLLEYLSHATSFYVLTISQRGSQLFRGEQSGLTNLELDSLPGSLEEALWYKEPDKLQIRSSSGDAGSYHGEGDDTRQPNTDLHDYLNKVDNAVTNYLKRDPGPLIVCALEKTLGVFNSLNKYSNRIGDIAANPETMSQDDLFARARKIAEDSSGDSEQQALDNYRRLEATEPDSITIDPAWIIEAAKQGRVGTLLISSPVIHHDVMAFHERVPSEHGSDTPALDDTTEMAVHHVLKNSGTVQFINQGELSDEARLAAILRY